MRKFLALLIAIAVAVAIYFAAHSVRKPANATSTAQLPQLSWTDLNGRSINMSNYKGKVVMVNFWAAWCTPCTAEIPQFVALQEKYGSKGLQIIGISIDDAESELRSFYRKHGMNYPVVAGDQRTGDAFGEVLGLPTTFIYDRSSQLRGRQVGSTNFAALEQQVVSLLQ